MTRDTSIEAYRDLVESGKINERQAVVLDALDRHGPCTARELGEKADLTQVYGYWVRLSELRRKGLVAEEPKRKCSVTQKNVIVWRATRRNGRQMDALNYELVSSCALCPQLGKDHVPSCGTPVADLMIVGQSPGRKEVEERQPFVGPSGELLDGMLAEIPLGREDVYIANVLKCHPPGNRPGVPIEKATCFKQWLSKEIKEVEPKVLLMLGKDAWSLVPVQWKPKNGKVVRNKDKGITFIFWYHPAYYLRRADVSGFLKVAELVKRELG